MNVYKSSFLLVFLLIFSIIGISSASADVPSPIQPIANSEFKEIFPIPVQTGLMQERIRFDYEHPSRNVAVHVPKHTPIIVPVHRTPKPTPTVKYKDSHAVSGTATWYCLRGQSACPWMASSGNFAAAGPALRHALGGGDHCKPGPHCWRNRYVTVHGNGHSVRVKLIDWCACGGGHVIDLFASAMRQFVGADKTGRPLRGGIRSEGYMVDFVHIDWCDSKGQYGALDCSCPELEREEMLLRKYAALYEAAEESLLQGQHEGPCDPDNAFGDACQQHVEAGKRRHENLEKVINENRA